MHSSDKCHERRIRNRRIRSSLSTSLNHVVHGCRVLFLVRILNVFVLLVSLTVLFRPIKCEDDPGPTEEKNINVKYSSRVVRTTYGDVRGIYLQPASGQLRSVEAYLGIPYSAPP